MKGGDFLNVVSLTRLRAARSLIEQSRPVLDPNTSLIDRVLDDQIESGLACIKHVIDSLEKRVSTE